MLEDHPPGRGIRHRSRLGLEITVSPSRQMNGEARIRLEVGEPVASPRRSGDEEPAIDVERPDLYSARRARSTTGCGDLDGRVVRQLVPHDLHAGKPTPPPNSNTAIR